VSVGTHGVGVGGFSDVFVRGSGGECSACYVVICWGRVPLVAGGVGHAVALKVLCRSLVLLALVWLNV
jgi:hypothetical protein